VDTNNKTEYLIQIAYLGYPFSILRILTESIQNKKVGNVRKLEKAGGGVDKKDNEHIFKV
jgi:hypothetical protein